jgi:hypothetical protein
VTRREREVELDVIAKTLRELDEAASNLRAHHAWLRSLPCDEDVPEGPVGTNAGHGHAWKRPDGLVARCGGPGMCSACSRDAQRLRQAMFDQNPGR